MILSGKTILVTGGTGSMGKIFVRRVLSGELGVPKKLIVLSRDEAKQHDMRVAHLRQWAATDDILYRNFLNTLEFRIGDVRDYSDVCAAIRTADIVVNAAALKQVPSCEYFPGQAVLTNCVGAMNIVRAIAENGYPVETVVAISTDKAAKPVNVMGMSKAIQERIMTAANTLNSNTRFISVRYGNVLASRGSVIPLFHEQIRRGGPVTITVPEMTRFLLSLNEAVDTVFAALWDARPGEIFVPNAPAATVMNIAKALIGTRAVEIVTTGIRPGEKMHEIMVSDEEAFHTISRGKYYAIQPMLPELSHKKLPDAIALENRPLVKELSSADTVLSLRGTVELLRRNQLLIDDLAAHPAEELLR